MEVQAAKQVRFLVWKYMELTLEEHHSQPWQHLGFFFPKPSPYSKSMNDLIITFSWYPIYQFWIIYNHVDPLGIVSNP